MVRGLCFLLQNLPLEPLHPRRVTARLMIVAQQVQNPVDEQPLDLVEQRPAMGPGLGDGLWVADNHFTKRFDRQPLRQPIAAITFGEAQDIGRSILAPVLPVQPLHRRR